LPRGEGERRSEGPSAAALMTLERRAAPEGDDFPARDPAAAGRYDRDASRDGSRCTHATSTARNASDTTIDAMAAASSFDVTSTIDFQEVDNALNQARKEVGQRYDFKGARADIELNAAEKKLTLTADDEFKMNALWEIVQTRMVRRGVPVKNFKDTDSEPAAGGTVRRVIDIQQGIPIEAAREIVKFIKEKKMKKVQASIQADQVRVSSPSKDELQEAMRQLREHDFGIALQFGNYR
jgi:hypothetical protein